MLRYITDPTLNDLMLPGITMNFLIFKTVSVVLIYFSVLVILLLQRVLVLHF